jgi:hypothetical protein
MQTVGFEPTQLSLPDLKTGSLDHSDMFAVLYGKSTNIRSTVEMVVAVSIHY